MANCGFALALIFVLAFLLFLWWIFQIDDDSFFPELDGCGNSNGYCFRGLPFPDIVTTQEDNNDTRVIRDSLDRFSLAEHEIDTLCRSYIIEHLCSCQDAVNTYERIEYLCDKLGDYLATSYGRDAGDRYASLKKECCIQLKKCIEYQNEDSTIWIEREAEIAQLLSTCNPCLSKEFIESIRRDHCALLMKMVNAHTEKNNLAAIVIYDSLREKTDTYVESVVSATLRCKAR